MTNIFVFSYADDCYYDYLKDSNLSLKAKGLLSYMLTLANEDFNALDNTFLMSRLLEETKDSESAVKTAIKELKNLGYLNVVKKMPDETRSGRIEYKYEIELRKI